MADTPSLADLPSGRARFFRVSVVKRGYRMPAIIARTVAKDPLTGEKLDRSPVLWAKIGLDYVAPHRVWLSGRETSRAEYEYQMKLMIWARTNKPDHPILKPTKPIEHDAMQLF